MSCGLCSIGLTFADSQRQQNKTEMMIKVLFIMVNFTFFTIMTHSVPKNTMRYLQTIISRIMSSVCCMPTEPILPRFWIVFSMSFSMMPSCSEIHMPSRASTAD